MIDIPKYLGPISDEEPSGPDLEFDPAYAALETLAKGKAEQQIGDSVRAAEEPDWREVESSALALLSRTRDLRIGVLLARATLRTSGFVGLADSLALLRSWLEGSWDTVHPRLDPDDGDPIFRTNALANLNGFETMLRFVRETPLVAAPRAGRYSLRDWLVATEKLPKPADLEGDPPSTALVQAAFEEAPLEQIQGTEAALGRAHDEAKGIEAALVAKVGASRSVVLGELKSMLDAARRLVAENLARRTGQPAGEAGDGEEGSAAGPAAPPGSVRTREDVVRTLDRCLEYFAKNEPSSPVPILLRRAQRLVNKSFLEIITDLAPDGLPQVEKFRGPEE